MPKYKLKNNLSQALGILDSEAGKMQTIDTGFGSHLFPKFSPSGENVYCVAGSPTRPYCVIEVDVETKQVVIIMDTKCHDIDPGYISEPQAITFPTEDNKVAHGYLYLPKVSMNLYYKLLNICVPALASRPYTLVQT